MHSCGVHTVLSDQTGITLYFSSFQPMNHVSLNLKFMVQWEVHGGKRIAHQQKVLCNYCCGKSLLNIPSSNPAYFQSEQYT